MEMREIETAKKRCESVIRTINHLPLSSPSCRNTLLKLATSELFFLSSLSSPQPLSTNIGHIESILWILQLPSITCPSRVCKPLPLPNCNVHVDLVCTLGKYPVWIIVSDRNPNYISWSDTRRGSKGLKTRIELVLSTAHSTTVLKPSSLILFFANGLPLPVYERLRDEFEAKDFDFGAKGVDFGAKDVDFGAKGFDSGAKGVDLGAKGVDIGANGVDFGGKGFDFGAKGVDFGAKGVDFRAKGVDFGGKGFDFGGKGVDFGAKGVDFGAKGVDFGAKGLDFGAKDLNFGAKGFDFDCEMVEGEWVNIVRTRSFKEAVCVEIKIRDGCDTLVFDEPVVVEEEVVELSDEDGFSYVLSSMRLKGEDSLVNFDTTALVALVSGIANGCAERIVDMSEIVLEERFKGNTDFVIDQARSEIEESVLVRMGDVLSGKRGIVCKSVVSEFKELVSMYGGPNEKQRAEQLLKRLMVVNDNPTERVMGLPTTRKLAMKNKIVFGTGDRWGAPTLTANMGFVRAVAQSGMSLYTIDHSPRALTGD